MANFSEIAKAIGADDPNTMLLARAIFEVAGAIREQTTVQKQFHEAGAGAISQVMASTQEMMEGLVGKPAPKKVADVLQLVDRQKEEEQPSGENPRAD